MNQTERGGGRSMFATIATAVLAGLVVLVLLAPASGVDPVPPVCYSVFGYIVPCSGGMAVAAGAATAGVVGLILRIAGRRRHST